MALLIGSTVLTLGDPVSSTIWREMSQSPPNRVNGSHLYINPKGQILSEESRNPLLIGSTVLTEPIDWKKVRRRLESQSPPNRVNGSHVEFNESAKPWEQASQSPPNRVNGSHREYELCPDCGYWQSQSPPNRVNGSHVTITVKTGKDLKEMSQSPPNRVNGSHVMKSMKRR